MTRLPVDVSFLPRQECFTHFYEVDEPSSARGSGYVSALRERLSQGGLG